MTPVTPDPDELEAVAALRAALRRFRTATDHVTAQQGLTPRQYDLLALLHAPQGSALTPTLIAGELCLSRSAATELINRASAAGLIARRPDSDDGRVKHVGATEEGTRRFFSAVAELRSERSRLLELLRLAATLAAVLSTAI